MEEKIARFKADLNLGTTHLVQKYITAAESEILTSCDHFSLKDAISGQFGVHPNEIILVGSAKVGFSLAPDKRYREFGDSSDLDVAIISPVLFDRVWHSVLDYKNSRQYWPKKDEFKHHFFDGWIRPDKLPPSRKFSFANEWWEYFTELSNSQRFGMQSINAGLYREMSFLDKYQSLCIEKCKQAESF